MAGRLILFAHAETKATRAASFPRDEPLVARGLAAAARCAASLPRHVGAWCSPALAARETAAAFGCAATVDPLLADLDCGRWCGSALVEIANADPTGIAAWLTDPTYAGHGGASIDDMLARVSVWLDRRRDDKGTTLAITHAAVVRCAVLATLGASANGFWHIDVAPLTRFEFSHDGRRWTLRQMVQA